MAGINVALIFNDRILIFNLCAQDEYAHDYSEYLEPLLHLSKDDNLTFPTSSTSNFAEISNDDLDFSVDSTCDLGDEVDQILTTFDWGLDSWSLEKEVCNYILSTLWRLC